MSLRPEASGSADTAMSHPLHILHVEVVWLFSCFHLAPDAASNHRAFGAGTGPFLAGFDGAQNKVFDSKET
jgi:hypothetical protein